MSHLPLDARAILHYLNDLGYRHISAEQLKEFLKDLRKLMKYEERFGVNFARPAERQEVKTTSPTKVRERLDKKKAKDKENEETKKLEQEKEKDKAKAKEKGKEKPREQQKEKDKVVEKAKAPEKGKVRVRRKDDPAERKRNMVLKNYNQCRPQFGQYYFHFQSDETTLPATTDSSIASSLVPIKIEDVKRLLNKLNKENTDRLDDLERRLKAIDFNFRKYKAPSTSENKENDVLKSNKAVQVDAMDIAPSPEEKPSKPSNVFRHRSEDHVEGMAPTYHIPKRKQRVRINDPVSLYHYYQKEWAHFGSRIPGSSNTALCPRAKFL